MPCDPAVANGCETVVACSRCGFDKVPIGQANCPKCGAFPPANQAAETHGLSRLRRGPSTPLDIHARDEQVAVFVQDKGGDAEVSSVQKGQLVDLAQAIQLRDAAWGYIALVGPLTRAGRQRAAVGLYLAASQRVQQLAAQVGLARSAAPVQDAFDVLREYQRPEANPTPASPRVDSPEGMDRASHGGRRMLRSASMPGERAGAQDGEPVL